MIIDLIPLKEGFEEKIISVAYNDSNQHTVSILTEKIKNDIYLNQLSQMKRGFKSFASRLTPSHANQQKAKMPQQFM